MSKTKLLSRLILFGLFTGCGSSPPPMQRPAPAPAVGNPSPDTGDTITSSIVREGQGARARARSTPADGFLPVAKPSSSDFGCEVMLGNQFLPLEETSRREQEIVLNRRFIIKQEANGLFGFRALSNRELVALTNQITEDRRQQAGFIPFLSSIFMEIGSFQDIGKLGRRVVDVQVVLKSRNPVQDGDYVSLTVGNLFRSASSRLPLASKTTLAGGDPWLSFKATYEKPDGSLGQQAAVVVCELVHQEPTQ